MNISKFTTLSIAAISVLFFMLAFTPVSSAQTLYSCSAPSFNDALVSTIDPSTGATISTIDATLPGVEVNGCTGLAKDPTTGTCYMMIATPNTADSGVPGARLLTVLNPFTGQIRLVGNTGQRFAGIAFDNGGTLYGITGQQNGAQNPLNPSTLFTINKNSGASTIFLPLVVDNDGESLGFNPNDGLLYRYFRGPDFQSVDPDTKAVTTIPLSGDDADEPGALTHLSGNVLLLTNTNRELFSITTDGVISFIGELDEESKGLAFDCERPGIGRPIPTLSQWGLIAMAGILGLVGFMVMRRRKVTA